MLKAITLGLVTFAAAARLFAQAGPSPDGGLVDKLLQPGNLAASTLLALNVIGFIRGWVVPAWVYQAEKSRADRMEDKAWKATEALVHAVTSVEKTAQAVINATQTPGPPGKSA